MPQGRVTRGSCLITGEKAAQVRSSWSFFDLFVIHSSIYLLNKYSKSINSVSDSSWQWRCSSKQEIQRRKKLLRGTSISPSVRTSKEKIQPKRGQGEEGLMFSERGCVGGRGRETPVWCPAGCKGRSPSGLRRSVRSILVFSDTSPYLEDLEQVGGQR